MEKEYCLQRFVNAQQNDYAQALQEITRGRKESHWMWYIFPQIQGLGRSATSQFYAIQDLDEARAFLAHPYLGDHLRQICQVLMQLDTDNATAVFGRPDDMKLRSSMTLFACAAGKPSVFYDVLDKYFGGRMDQRTKQILGIS